MIWLFTNCGFLQAPDTGYPFSVSFLRIRFPLDIKIKTKKVWEKSEKKKLTRDSIHKK